MQKNIEKTQKKQNFITPFAAGHEQKRVPPIPSKTCTQQEVPKKMKINLRHPIISLNKQGAHVQGEKESIIEYQQENLRKRPTMSMDTFLETHGIHLERDVEPSTENERPTQEKEQNLTESNCPAMTIEAFLKTHGIYFEGEQEHSGENANDAGNIDDEDDDDDDFSDDEEFIGEYEDDVLHGDVNQFMETNNVEGIPKKRKRGKTMCSKIHLRTWEEREEVIFHEGQAIGPTKRRVKDLTYFIGTVGRSSEFITLMYTSWKAVPPNVKRRMWKYIRSKFILPREGKKWVMIGVREAWKRYKTRIKKKHFDIYNNMEDMLKNRPLNIPEVQFRKLIAYWSIPSVQAMCRANSQNRKKQQHQHRMGPISFARVRKEMREMNENKESPSQVDVFITTRTGRKGKELDLETQAVFDKLKHYQEAEDTPENAFCVVFGKEKPGRV